MNIIELFYDADDIAYYTMERDMGNKAQMEFVEWVFLNEHEFLRPEYKESLRELKSDVLYYSNYIADNGEIDRDIEMVGRDFDSFGKSLDAERLVPDYWKYHSLLFKCLRLDIRSDAEHPYKRMKLRTLLREHDRARRTPLLNLHIVNCLIFYHLQPYLRDGELCEISKIDLDDMITFRAL